MGRIRYADKITQLSGKGEVINEGTPDELLEPLDGELHIMESEDVGNDIQHAVTHIATLEDELEQDETRRLGDTSMYSFYARAAGRGMLASLTVCMAVYAFCQSFPCEYNWQPTFPRRLNTDAF